MLGKGSQDQVVQISAREVVKMSNLHAATPHQRRMWVDEVHHSFRLQAAGVGSGVMPVLAAAVYDGCGYIKMPLMACDLFEVGYCIYI